MTRLCLDTSAYSNFHRGHPATVDHADRAGWIGLPSVVLGELRAGFLLGGSTPIGTQRKGIGGEFLDHPVVEIVRSDEEAARIYGEIVVDLRRKGTPLPTNDVRIAAAAARAGAAVLTFDAHFRERCARRKTPQRTCLRTERPCGALGNGV